MIGTAKVSGLVLGALLLAPAGALALTVPDSSPAGAHQGGAQEGGGAYEVGRGDTLWKLARRLSTTVSRLAERNDLEDPDRIVVGQELEVPGGTDLSGARTIGDVEPGTPEETGSDERGSDEREVHVVAPGETLSEIAARHGVSVEDLAAANGITDRDTVWVGSRLWVTAEAPALPEPSAQARYRVRRGDTLSGIAARVDTSVAELVEANGLADPDRVVAGTVLSVPGAWRCPVPEVTRMIDDFGAPRPGDRFHEGIDLFAERGAPVRAPVSGAARAVEGERGGLQITLEGDDGSTYVASHLEAFGETGRVEAGAVVGRVGSSGNAAGSDPHVHFEVHPDDGVAVNPFPLLERACGTG